MVLTIRLNVNPYRKGVALTGEGYVPGLVYQYVLYSILQATVQKKDLRVVHMTCNVDLCKATLCLVLVF